MPVQACNCAGCESPENCRPTRARLQGCPSVQIVQLFISQGTPKHWGLQPFADNLSTQNFRQAGRKQGVEDTVVKVNIELHIGLLFYFPNSGSDREKRAANPNATLPGVHGCTVQFRHAVLFPLAVIFPLDKGDEVDEGWTRDGC